MGRFINMNSGAYLVLTNIENVGDICFGPFNFSSNINLKYFCMLRTACNLFSGTWVDRHYKYSFVLFRTVIFDKVTP